MTSLIKLIFGRFINQAIDTAFILDNYVPNNQKGYIDHVFSSCKWLPKFKCSEQAVKSLLNDRVQILKLPSVLKKVQDFKKDKIRITSKEWDDFYAKMKKSFPQFEKSEIRAIAVAHELANLALISKRKLDKPKKLLEVMKSVRDHHFESTHETTSNIQRIASHEEETSSSETTSSEDDSSSISTETTFMHNLIQKLNSNPQIKRDIKIDLEKHITADSKYHPGDEEFSIEGNLPLWQPTLTDAPRKLPAYAIDEVFYPESPEYASLLDAPSYTRLKEDKDRSKFKAKIENIFSPIVSLLNKINEDQTMTSEKRKKLWDILQLSRTQCILHPFASLTFDAQFLEHMDKIIKEPMSAEKDQRQDRYIEYRYDEQNKMLKVVFHQRTYMTTSAGTPLKHFVYSKMTMNIDLKQQEIDPSYDVFYEAVPTSRKTQFDDLKESSSRTA